MKAHDAALAGLHENRTKMLAREAERTCKRFFVSLKGWRDSMKLDDPPVALELCVDDIGGGIFTFWHRERRAAAHRLTLKKVEASVATGEWIELTENEAENHLYACRKQKGSPPWPYQGPVLERQPEAPAPAIDPPSTIDAAPAARVVPEDWGTW